MGDANRPNFRSHEKFSVTFLDGEDEGKVAFKGHQGKYLVAENTGKVNCNRDNLGSYEKWTVRDEGSGLSFKSVHGKYLVAENNGDLNANRDPVGSFEIFTVVHLETLFGCTKGSDCTIGLKSHDNKYVGATNSGEADANRPKFRAYEKFSVTFLDGEDE